jgi:hypothetical protein
VYRVEIECGDAVTGMTLEHSPRLFDMWAELEVAPTVKLVVRTGDLDAALDIANECNSVGLKALVSA